METSFNFLFDQSIGKESKFLSLDSPGPSLSPKKDLSLGFKRSDSFNLSESQAKKGRIFEITHDFSICGLDSIRPSEGNNFEEGTKCLGEKANQDTLLQKKRGRKKLKKTPEMAEQTKEIRAKKNRVLAKESRERKKLYIAQLESQILSLKWELLECKKKLSVYEKREAEIRDNSAKGYQTIGSDSQSAQECYLKQMLDVAHDEAASMTKVAASFQRGTVERRKALEALATALLELMVPFPHKCILWGTDFTSRSYPAPSHSPGEGANVRIASIEEWKSIMNKLNVQDLDIMKDKKFSRFFCASAVRAQKSAQKLLKCYNNAVNDMSAFDKAMFNFYENHMTLDTFKSYVTWLQKVMRFHNSGDYSILSRMEGMGKIEWPLSNESQPRLQICSKLLTQSSLKEGSEEDNPK